MKAMNLILAILFLIGCDKDSSPDSTDQLSLVWRVPKGIKPYDQKSLDPVLYKDRLVIGYQTESDEGFVIYNKDTGKRIKEINATPSFDPTSYLYKNIYYSTYGPRFRTINLDNFQVSWHTVQSFDGNADIAMTFVNDKVLVPINSIHSPSPVFRTNQIMIVESAISDLKNWNPIIDIKSDFDSTSYGTGLRNITAYTNPKGQLIYFFTSSKGYHNVNTLGDCITHAYNATTKKFEWSSEIFNDGGDFSKSIIYGNHIITSTGTKIISRDINSGKIIWTSTIEAGAVFSITPILFNGTIIFTDWKDSLYKMDASTGKVLKKLNIEYRSTGNWAFHNGILYFTAGIGKLMAIDAESLTVKWEITSPNRERCSPCTFWSESPVVDPETNRIYISDAWEVFCYQLPNK